MDMDGFYVWAYVWDTPLTPSPVILLMNFHSVLLQQTWPVYDETEIFIAPASKSRQPDDKRARVWVSHLRFEIHGMTHPLRAFVLLFTAQISSQTSTAFLILTDRLSCVCLFSPPPPPPPVVLPGSATTTCQWSGVSKTLPARRLTTAPPPVCVGDFTLFCRLYFYAAQFSW